MFESSSRLRRLPKRIYQDLLIIQLTRNWRELLRLKAERKSYYEILFRNGVVLRAPEQVSLDFLFHEIWLDEFYAPSGYKIGPGEVVLDIGANIGVFALWAATRSAGVQVRSYEPFPANAEYFIKNVEDSGVQNIDFRSAAVADSDGIRRLCVEDSWILHSLADKGSNESGLEVESVSLNTALSNLPVCDLLKLDCEGGEYEILYGAKTSTLEKVRRIVCEFNDLDVSERNGESLRKFLEANGFVVDIFRMLDPDCGFICAKRTRG